jgi:hypothetical protein
MDYKFTKPPPPPLDTANYKLGHFMQLPQEIILLIIEASGPFQKAQFSRTCHFFWKQCLKFAHTVVYYSNENLPMSKLSDTLNAIVPCSNQDFFTRVVSITTYQSEQYMSYAPLTYSLILNGFENFPQRLNLLKMSSLVFCFPDASSEAKSFNYGNQTLNFLRLRQFRNLELLVFRKLAPSYELLEFCSKNYNLKVLKILRCKLDFYTNLMKFIHLQVLVMELEHSDLLLDLPPNLEQSIIQTYGNHVGRCQYAINAISSNMLKYFEFMLDSPTRIVTVTVNLSNESRLNTIFCNGTQEQVTFRWDDDNIFSEVEAVCIRSDYYPFLDNYDRLDEVLFPECIECFFFDQLLDD